MLAASPSRFAAGRRPNPLGHPDVPHGPARADGADRLHYRLLRADAFQHGSGTDSVGHIFDTGDA
jgi:hypothetical protein